MRAATDFRADYTKGKIMNIQLRQRLLATTLLVGAAAYASPVFAQDVPVAPVAEPVAGDPVEAVDESTPETSTPGEEIVVTGSRIARPNLSSNSPIVVSTGEQVVESGDITLDTYLNTLPQVNPAGTTTSNNPGNGGQSNIDLRGLGSNRNLVLIDGRRPMVGGTTMAVDLNTIPQGLIERIEVITGGAGATYGADAIAGVANIILKKDFTGFELRAGYSNSIPEVDAREYQISGTLGASFDDGRGNVALTAEYADRQGITKFQRPFAVQATSTTGTPPVGKLIEGGAAITQASINDLFATYGVPAAQIPTSGNSLLHFNSDGSLFSGGAFNSPLDVANYGYDPAGADPAAANQNFFPDFYSYNFDAINLLTLPLKRKSMFVRGNYEANDNLEFFFQGGYTEYKSANALAPTPVGVRIYRDAPSGQFASSNLLCGAGSTLVQGCGTPTTATNGNTNVTNSIVPVTNPFIPADLAILLATRVGSDPLLVGSGATEPIRLAIRSLNTGLRTTTIENQVLQGLFGIRGEITEGWRYEAYYSYGRTVIDSAAAGNVNVQNLQALLEDPFGGAGRAAVVGGLPAVAPICEGGYNPFGIQPLSDDCIEYLNETGFTSTRFTQKIAQGYVTGNLFALPAGDVSVVLGLENRRFSYAFDPGALFGPIAGFNTSTPSLGTNSFMDYFGELYIPILKDQPWAQQLDVTFGYRRSKSDFNDIANDVDGRPQKSDAWKAEISYQPIDALRLRASYQKSVRAPNFGELFSSGASFVNAFDPCSLGTQFRETGGPLGSPDAARDFCIHEGVGGGNDQAVTPAQIAAYNGFAATPGLQVNTGFSGNPDLTPEKGTTFTVGGVFQKWGFTGSLDYYNIKIKDKIFGPDTNMLIAACYGYVEGIAADLNGGYCQSVNRSGGNISSIGVKEPIGGDFTSNFLTVNRGIVKTAGIDMQLAYKIPMDFIQPSARLSLDLFANYLITYKNEELRAFNPDGTDAGGVAGGIKEYAGTVGFFGSTLGQSFPRVKATLNAALEIKPITLSTRIRYIHKMTNKGLKLFPGETEDSFGGVPKVIYVDVAAQADITKAFSLRLGLNNALDKQPPVYSPNFQSGTDPSLYDVIGRRAYVQARVKF